MTIEAMLDGSRPTAWTPRAQRTVTTLLVGRLVHQGADHLCRVRNVSAGGAMIETEAPLHPGSRIAIELRSPESLTGAVRWARPDAIGMEFDTEADLGGLLTAARSAPVSRILRHVYRLRGPRFDTACPARLRTSGDIFAATLANISQGGACIALDHALSDGEPLVLTVPGLAPRLSMLRWSDAGKVGVAFAEPLPFRELAAWLAAPEHRFSAAR